MADRQPQDVAEAHRRFQLSTGWGSIADLSRNTDWRQQHPVGAKDTPTLRHAIQRLMVGSHAHRHRLEHERTA